MVFIKLTFSFLFFFITLTSTTSAGVTDANSDYTDLSSHEGNAQGFQFNNDGKKFFVVGKTGDLTQFSLSTAYDVSTASHEGEIDIPGQGTGMTGLAFSGNGMVMFVVNESTDKVHPFTLNTAWNPIGGIASTGTAVSVVSGDNCPTDLQFNNDGSKLYIIGCQGDRVDEYDLTSNYTLNATMSVARTSVNVSDRNPRAVIFSPDGTIMITNGIQDGCLPHQFTLSTPFDVSSAVSNGELTVSPEGCRSMSFNDDGTKIYFIKRTGTIFEYDVSPAYKIRDSAPALGSSVPADNATNVATDANIVLNFNEAVDVETGNITIKKTSDNSTVATIDVTSGQVSGSGTSQITINPTSDLPAGETELYVLIDASAFDNSGSLSYAGISSTTALSFTTATLPSNTNPSLSSSSPSDNATDVALDANIVLNFSENVDVETGNITIKKTSDNSTFETIDVTSSNVTGTGSTQITINPSSNFDDEVEYYVLIDATAFDDSESGSYAGISSTTALSFTTGKSDPTNDKVVTGSIDAQVDHARLTFVQSVEMVSSRLGYLRHNRNNNNLSKNNIKLDFGNAMLASISKALITPISENNNMSIIPDDWSTWSEGSISITKIGDTSTSSEKEIDSQGIAFGFDKKINDNDIYGFAIQYGQSDTDIGSNGSGIDSKNYNISMYRTRPLDDNNFIEGSIGIGKIKSDIERKSDSNTLTASRDGNQIFGSVNFGKTIDKGNFNLEPALRVDLGYTELEGYQEVGTDALSYDDQEVQSGLLSLGFGVNNLVKFDDSTIKPFGLIEFGLDFSDSSVTKLNYVSDTSTTYTYTQDTISDYMLTSEVGFSYVSKDNLSINTSYKRIQGEKHEHTDTLSFGLNFKSKRETEYAMQFGGTEDLSAGLNIAKNINGLDFNFKLDQEFNENRDKNAEISMIKKF